MTRILRVAICLLPLLGWSRFAGAQTPQGYVGGAFSSAPWSTHNVNGGSPSTTFSNVSEKSTVTTFTAEAGVFFNHTGSVGVEIGVPSNWTNFTQQSNYLFSQFLRTVRYQEGTCLVVMRGPIASRGRVGVVAVGGAGLVFGTAYYRTARTTSGTPGPFGPETKQTATSSAVAGGVDVNLAATQHIKVVPQFRTLLLPRGAADKHFGDFGLPRVIFRVGVGVQAAF